MLRPLSTRPMHVTGWPHALLVSMASALRACSLSAPFAHAMLQRLRLQSRARAWVHASPSLAQALRRSVPAAPAATAPVPLCSHRLCVADASRLRSARASSALRCARNQAGQCFGQR